MTFDEATESINVLSPFSTVYGISPTVVRNIISKLKEEYAPTVEMTKAEKTMLLNYLEMSSFREFMDVIMYQDGDLYQLLSDEEIIQAWLHPETIKVVD